MATRSAQYGVAPPNLHYSDLANYQTSDIQTPQALISAPANGQPRGNRATPESVAAAQTQDKRDQATSIRYSQPNREPLNQFVQNATGGGVLTEDKNSNPFFSFFKNLFNDAIKPINFSQENQKAADTLPTTPDRNAKQASLVSEVNKSVDEENKKRDNSFY